MARMWYDVPIDILAIFTKPSILDVPIDLFAWFNNPGLYLGNILLILAEIGLALFFCVTLYSILWQWWTVISEPKPKFACTKCGYLNQLTNLYEGKCKDCEEYRRKRSKRAMCELCNIEFDVSQLQYGRCKTCPALPVQT